MGREDMRAGDSDRQVVATRLREALDEGRLDLHEYDERLQRVYAAKTYGELDALTTDLPGVVPAAKSQVAPGPAVTPPAGPHGAHHGRSLQSGPGRSSIGGYAGVVIVCVLIWLISSATTGHLLYPWPAWMLIPLVWMLIGRRRS